MLRRKLHESLTVRIFLITLLILLGAGAITFALIAWATPITYTAAASDDLRAQTDLLVERLSVTALEAVPQEYEDASLALGATPIETYFKVSVPAAKSGIAAAVVLGVGRAIGEAMAVMMVSGNVPNMPGIFTSVRFLTTAVASEMSYSAGLQRQALFSIALVLFLFIMLINATLNFFLKRDKEG